MAAISLISVQLPAHAAPSPAPSVPLNPTLPELGRANPYRPLINKREPGAGAHDVSIPGPQAVPPAPMMPLAPQPRPLMEALEFVGVAYDGGESIAAVRVDGKTMLVKKGEQLDGATVTQITPYKLVWRKAGRTIVKHIRRNTRS